MALDGLPREVLCLILDSLERVTDVVALVRTCRHVRQALRQDGAPRALARILGTTQPDEQDEYEPTMATTRLRKACRRVVASRAALGMDEETARAAVRALVEAASPVIRWYLLYTCSTCTIYDARIDLNRLTQALEFFDDEHVREYGDRTLETAASEGNLEAVRTLLRAGADAGLALSTMARWYSYRRYQQNNTDILKALVAACKDVNAHVNDRFFGPPLLQKVVRSCDNDVVHALLKAGVDVNATDSAGRTALMMAVDAHDVNTACALVAAGADVNATDSAGRTALMMAAECRISTLRASFIKIFAKR